MWQLVISIREANFLPLAHAANISGKTRSVAVQSSKANLAAAPELAASHILCLNSKCVT
jgi:hypothetical protein